MLEDLRRALRSLLKTPGFTAVAVLILALGIGANAAIFSLVDRVLLQPLPFRNPDRLVALWGRGLARPDETFPLSAPDFLDWQRQAQQLDGMAALTHVNRNLTGAGEAQVISGGRVSWNFLQVLGVQPALGRSFLPEEDRAGGPRAVILSHDFWQRQFGADPALIGRSIHLDGEDYPVVGIMPPGFRFPYRIGGQFLVPMAFPADETTVVARGRRFMAVVARLKPGATLASCQTELRGIAQGLAVAYPDSNRSYTALVKDLHAQVVEDSRGTLLLLLGAVACVLLIACANLMNLMLARSARRQREMAIRAALGAGPATLVWNALAESLVLGLLGGAAGLLLARWIMAGLGEMIRRPLNQPEPLTLTMEPRLLLFTFSLSILAAVLFGLLPALKLERINLAGSLKEGKGSATGSHPRLRGLLVASETALATALLIGAGLMLRSLAHLRKVDPGFQADRVLVAPVALPAYRYPDLTARAALVERLQRRLEATPGVESAAINDTAPLSRATSSSGYDVAGQVSPDEQSALNHHISTGYFRTMGIPLLQGRDFLPGETAAVIISRGFRDRHFRNSDPLQGQISMDGEHEPFYPVVGVVGEVHHSGLAQPTEPEMYFPAGCPKSGGEGPGGFTVAVRTTVRPEAMAKALKQALRELDPDLPLGKVGSMAEALTLDRQNAEARSVLLGSFAGLALVLAGVGIYAVMAFLTGLRTREIGVRMALGAQLRDVLTLVVGQGLRMALTGIGIGVAIALLMGRTLGTLISGVPFWDPATLAAVVMVLFLTAALACLWPALRAAKVSPMVALRNE